ncbi:hypothetical protein TWF718_009015 [Orbilia javanica]|uniref:Uncharacterized protein n=1 Tax=Orbilia javanica TaxID=47235 RepID=A0AAN8RGP8_9PEZI
MGFVEVLIFIIEGLACVLVGVATVLRGLVVQLQGPIAPLPGFAVGTPSYPVPPPNEEIETVERMSSTSDMYNIPCSLPSIKAFDTMVHELDAATSGPPSYSSSGQAAAHGSRGAIPIEMLLRPIGTGETEFEF